MSWRRGVGRTYPLKAARVMLGWSAGVLAERSEVSIATIKKYEQQDGIPRANARILDSIARTLTLAGIQFTGDPLVNPGVTLDLGKREAALGRQ